MRLNAIVYGEVQGIFFRDFTRTAAQELGLKGWVKNVRNSVEVIAEGPEDKLKELLEKLKEGPAAAKIVKVDSSFEKATGEFEDFEVKY